MNAKFDDITEFTSTNSVSNLITSKQNEMIQRYFDMEYIAATIEDSIVLNNPIKRHIPGKSREIEEEYYQEDKIVVGEYRTKNIKLNKKLNKQIATRKMLFSIIREVYPSFCQDIEKKMPEKEYNFYYQQQKKLRQVIANRYNDSVYDIRASEFALKRKDNISELIDSEDFSRACLIEDQFMRSEFQKYLELLKTVPKEEQHLQKRQKISYKETTISAEDLARISLEDRDDRIMKLKKILELFSKIKSKNYMKIPNKDEEPYYNK